MAMVTAMNINRTVIAPYPAADMYALVDDIAAYPDFLPWCAGAEVTRDAENVHARLAIQYHGFRTFFATRNTHNPNDRIYMELAEGPLSELTGEWQFIPLDAQRCRIELKLQYEFSNALMAAALSKIFSYIFDHFIEHFINRARSQCKKIAVEIVHAADAGAQVQSLHLAPGATVADALATANIPYSDNISVYGKLCQQQTPLASGDRIEINQPLPKPPQEARRERQ